MERYFESWFDYFYHTDFTAHRERLEKIQEGAMSYDDQRDLIDILNAVDEGRGKGCWNLREDKKEWSLAKAVVIYNGPNTNHLPTRSRYQRVLVLEMAAASFAPRGKLYLCYN